MTWGAAIGAIGGIVSALGNRGPNAAERLRASREAVIHDSAAFRQRIKDLRSMGISPLMAAGSTVQSTPQVFGGKDYSGLERSLSAAGQSLDNYQSTKKAEAHNAILREATVAEAQSRIRLNDSQTALAQFQLSQQALAAHQRAASPSAPSTTPSAQFDQVKNVPVEVVSRQRGSTHTAAGSQPAFQEVEVRPGVKVMMPLSNEGFHEQAESFVNPAYLANVLAANIERYGAQEGVNRVAAIVGADGYTRFLFKYHPAAVAYRYGPKVPALIDRAWKYLKQHDRRNNPFNPHYKRSK